MRTLSTTIVVTRIIPGRLQFDWRQCLRLMAGGVKGGGGRLLRGRGRKGKEIRASECPQRSQRWQFVVNCKTAELNLRSQPVEKPRDDSLWPVLPADIEYEIQFTG